MNTDHIKNSVQKNYSFANFSDAIINQINADFDEMMVTQKSHNIDYLTELLENIYNLKIKELIENGQYDIVINYIKSTKVTGKQIFGILSSFLKRIGAELSFDLGVYLLDNYSSLNMIFGGIANYLKSSKGVDLKTIINDDAAELLFDLYCDRNGIKLNDDIFDNLEYTEGFYSDDSVKMYLHEITRYPLLTPEEEQDLFLEYKNNHNKYAQERLVNCNLRLVVNIAKQYIARINTDKTPFLDLIQEGNIGLMKAIDRFEPSKGYKLSTYATWWIRQNISRYISDHANTIRIPVHLGEKIRKISKASELFLGKNDREPTIDELVQLTGLPKNVVLDCRRIISCYGTTVSLDAPIGDEEESTLGDFIPTEDIIEEDVESILLKDDVEKVLKTLKPKEAMVIRARFGIDTGFPKTLGEIGNELGITRERVRQIEAVGLRKLRMPSRVRMLEGDAKVKIDVIKKKKNSYSSFISELKRSPKTYQSYVLNGLSNEERTIVLKKFGEGFNQNNYIGQLENDFVENILPKMEQRFIRISCNTLTYKGLFEKYDSRISVDNYYLLNDNEQRLLKYAYGEDLSSTINSNISFEEEKRIAKIIVPKMVSFNLSRAVRKYNSYEYVLQNNDFVIPDYVANIFMYLYPHKNITILSDNVNTNNTIAEGIDYVLAASLKPEQFDYLKNLFKGLKIDRIRSDYSNKPKLKEIIGKLEKSPHVLAMSNKLLDMAEEKTLKDGDLFFYSFFSKDEIKKLPSALRAIGFEDFTNIYKVFKRGINIPVYKETINDRDYYNLSVAIKNIKLSIRKSTSLNNSYNIGPLYELYRFCDYLYGKPEFIHLLTNLGQAEIELLADLLSVPVDFDASIKYVSSKRGVDDIRILSSIKQLLRKIYITLQSESIKKEFEKEDVELVLKLIKDQTD